jgi:hypothetical protein
MLDTKGRRQKTERLISDDEVEGCVSAFMHSLRHDVCALFTPALRRKPPPTIRLIEFQDRDKKSYEMSK